MDKAAANTTMETTGFNHPMGFPLKLRELYCLVSAGRQNAASGCLQKRFVGFAADDAGVHRDARRHHQNAKTTAAYVPVASSCSSISSSQWSSAASWSTVTVRIWPFLHVTIRVNRRLDAAWFSCTRKTVTCSPQRQV